MLLFKINLSAQTYVNKEWDVINANPIGLEWTNSILSTNGYLIHVGNTLDAGEGANIITTVYDGNGDVVWQDEFNTSSNNNDYGAAVAEDASGNVYVVGSYYDNTDTNYNVILLKYSSSGSLTWSATYDSPYELDDYGSGLALDGSGNIYVCGASKGDTTANDYLLLKYNASGSLQWDKRYDYAQWDDVPVGVKLNGAGNVFVCGASASSATAWDYTIAKFSPSGTFYGDVRDTLSGFGYNQITDFVKDNDNNIYLTGSASTNGIDYDIRTIKLNSLYQQVWAVSYDFANLTDAAAAIDLDENGNAYVAGYITNQAGIKEMYLIKYDTAGTEVWNHRQAGANSYEDAQITALYVKTEDKVFFAASEKLESGKISTITSRLDENGDIVWQKTLSASVDVSPTDINVNANNEVLLSATQMSSSNQYEFVKYSSYQLNNNTVNNTSGKPLYKANELIVRFKQNALNKNAIDDKIGSKKAEYGKLDYYLTTEAMAAIDSVMDTLCGSTLMTLSGPTPNPCGIMAVKVFKQLKTTDTLTINRLGDTIPIPDFWTALNLVFPEGVDITLAHQIMNTLSPYVAYAEPVLMIEASSTPNDSLYNEQLSLYASASYPGADINVEEAWDIYPKAGDPKVRCGVFDAGIDWKHEDFGYDGINSASSKINGWCFYENIPLKAHAASVNGDHFFDPGHGTCVGGIIAANRNNLTGVTGIAGGNDSINTNFSKGVEIYNMTIIGPYSNPVNYIYDAIVTSALKSDTMNYAYGLNLSNNSWGIGLYSHDYYTDTNFTLLRESYHFVNRMNVTNCVARGNDGVDTASYPACLDDDWIINVGGTGENGFYVHNTDDTTFMGLGPANGDFWASFGKGVDIGAPATAYLIKTTGKNNVYRSFGKTSAATPHVSGVVALLMSYCNDTVDAYGNLAPEDCEHIIQLSAKDDAFKPGYDDYIGYGLLDAGKAMRLVEKPWNKVQHFGSNHSFSTARSKTLVGSMDTVKLQERYQNQTGDWFPIGKYRVNTWKITNNVLHWLNDEDSIIAYWPRPSSSTVLEAVKADSLLPRERVEINSCNKTTCSISGYVYEVFDLSGTPLGWWPFDTTLSKATMEYSILTHDTAAPDDTTSVTEIPEYFNQLGLYPNPASQSQHIHILCAEPNQNIQITLFDMQGKEIMPIYKGKSHTKEFSVVVNVGKLKPALYFYKLQIAGEIQYLKFVKQ